MNRLALAALLIAAVGCKKKETGISDVTPPSSHDAGHTTSPADAASATTPAMAPAERAKQIVAAQVAALEKDDAAIAATFDPAAIVLVPDPRPARDPLIGLRAAITRMAPTTSLKSVSGTVRDAGGNAGAVWWTADLVAVREDGTSTVRVTELATADAGWKVAAAAFSEETGIRGRAKPLKPFEGANAAGPLTPLVADPAKLAIALASDAQVITPDGDVRGDAAKKLVSSWTGVTLDNTPRELRGATWGFAIVQLSQVVKGEKHPVRMLALLLAVPGAGDAWSVVAAHYTAP